MPRPLAAAKLSIRPDVHRAAYRLELPRVHLTDARLANGPAPKRSGRTATTAFRTLTFRYTLMLVTFTTVVRLTTTLSTTRGPPQPPHQARPTKPGRPHHGTHGSPQPSATQLTKGAPMETRMPGAPKKATSAGA